ncbi:tyrosine-type recombinase/integrase [Oleiagrimonas sp. C23AA]|uniref:tyrosine-type recombinase/integrase n=1 Tax=Oleiagrimonas sp. C23AA TaxID=2719047 RepID=UPI00141EB56E|nr:tyrosine-type recombinase/integrase [Oleiagrimonas sp. C23AA]NII11554.1 tyrosine-type recombinase/integrase [Oleiagrimonas sp. C23AA]
MPNLTHRGLKALKAGKYESDGGARGAGTLQARRAAGGAVWFYYRYTRSNGERDTLPIGGWKDTGGTLSLDDARKRVQELAKQRHTSDRDLREVLEAEEREAARRREEERKAAEAAEARKNASLAALLNAYVEHMRREGKSSADHVQRSLKRHVLNAWPVLAAKPAEDITADDLTEVVAKVHNEGKRTEARKLRAYLQAAYKAARSARHDAAASPALRQLCITTNPARDTAAISGGSNARHRALSVAELRAYWKRICELPEPTGGLLRFHLLTGGQRIEQLGRATVNDIDQDIRALRLLDGKGRRQKPRVHMVPLTQAASEALQAMRGEAAGPYVFTITAGVSGASATVMHHRIKDVSTAMEEAGELEQGPFTPGDIRRTVETRLAAEGVSLEARAQLQSHGLGGVQHRHYDRHDYLDEKRTALETLYRLLTADSATVTPIRGRKAERA